MNKNQSMHPVGLRAMIVKTLANSIPQLHLQHDRLRRHHQRRGDPRPPSSPPPPPSGPGGGGGQQSGSRQGVRVKA